ncbi:MAG: cytochrome [Rhizorhabdus sp.]|nr:cytochrome [Rhizorhabdus sp.]
MARQGHGLAAGTAIIAALVAAGTGLSQGIGDTSGGGHATASSSGGEQVYREICQACHMPNAEGGTGAGNVPALAANAHLADADFTLNRVLRGQGGMPAFSDMLAPEQVAGVVGYIRTHFGNDYPKPVTVEDVKRLSVGLEKQE